MYWWHSTGGSRGNGCGGSDLIVFQKVCQHSKNPRRVCKGNSEGIMNPTAKVINYDLRRDNGRVPTRCWFGPFDDVMLDESNEQNLFVREDGE